MDQLQSQSQSQIQSRLQLLQRFQFVYSQIKNGNGTTSLTSSPTSFFSSFKSLFKQLINLAVELIQSSTDVRLSIDICERIEEFVQDIDNDRQETCLSAIVTIWNATAKQFPNHPSILYKLYQSLVRASQLQLSQTALKNLLRFRGKDLETNKSVMKLIWNQIVDLHQRQQYANALEWTREFKRVVSHLQFVSPTTVPSSSSSSSSSSAAAAAAAASAASSAASASSFTSSACPTDQMINVDRALSIIYYDMKDYKQSEIYARSVFSYQPNSIAAHFLLLRPQMAQNKEQDALKSFHKLMRVCQQTEKNDKTKKMEEEQATTTAASKVTKEFGCIQLEQLDMYAICLLLEDSVQYSFPDHTYSLHQLLLDKFLQQRKQIMISSSTTSPYPPSALVNPFVILYNLICLTLQRFRQKEQEQEPDKLSEEYKYNSTNTEQQLWNNLVEYYNFVKEFLDSSYFSVSFTSSSSSFTTRLSIECNNSRIHHFAEQALSLAYEQGKKKQWVRSSQMFDFAADLYQYQLNYTFIDPKSSTSTSAATSATISSSTHSADWIEAWNLKLQCRLLSVASDLEYTTQYGQLKDANELVEKIKQLYQEWEQSPHRQPSKNNSSIKSNHVNENQMSVIGTDSLSISSLCNNTLVPHASTCVTSSSSRSPLSLSTSIIDSRFEAAILLIQLKAKLLVYQKRPAESREDERKAKLKDGNQNVMEVESSERELPIFVSVIRSYADDYSHLNHRFFDHAAPLLLEGKFIEAAVVAYEISLTLQQEQTPAALDLSRYCRTIRRYCSLSKIETLLSSLPKLLTTIQLHFSQQVQYSDDENVKPVKSISLFPLDDFDWFLHAVWNAAVASSHQCKDDESILLLKQLQPLCIVYRSKWNKTEQDQMRVTRSQTSAQVQTQNRFPPCLDPDQITQQIKWIEGRMKLRQIQQR